MLSQPIVPNDNNGDLWGDGLDIRAFLHCILDLHVGVELETTFKKEKEKEK